MGGLASRKIQCTWVDSGLNTLFGGGASESNVFRQFLQFSRPEEMKIETPILALKISQQETEWSPGGMCSACMRVQWTLHYVVQHCACLVSISGAPPHTTWPRLATYFVRQQNPTIKH